MRNGTFIVLGAACCALAVRASAEVRTQEVDYRQGETPLRGFLAYDDAVQGKRPGILVVHEWWGQNEHARNQARKLAQAGYVAFAVDMFGKGKVTTHPSEAKEFVAEVTKNRDILDARFAAGLAVLKQQPRVDTRRIGVFGYCFGGTVALSEARTGANVDALAIFHAGLKPVGPPAQKGKMKAPVLVQTGGADPYVPKEQVQAFEEEMKAAGVDAQVITYPNAKHSFTNPDADKAGLPALGYDADAAEKSWGKALDFLRKVFGS